MGLLWHVIGWLVHAALNFFGAKHDWVKEEIDSKPRSDVL